MVNADIDNSIAKQLGSALQLMGFRWLRARGQFIRKETHGFSCFLWTSYPTDTELVLTPVCGVRHDAVEDVVNKLGIVYGDDNKRYTTTVDRGLAFFPFQEGVDYKQYVREATLDDDIANVARALKRIVEEDGKPFFERYSSLLECSRGLNEPIASRAHPLCNNLPSRIYHGIASAWFAERHRMPELKTSYLAFAKEALPAREYSQTETRTNTLLSILN